MVSRAVVAATERDLPTLSTIVPRAFHSSNEYFRRTLPDTPLLKQWWSDLLLDAIQDPNYHVLTIIEGVNVPQAREAIGILLLRRIEADGGGENVFHRHPPTADHDRARYAAMLAGTKGGLREKVMGGRSHFSLDLFGVDDRYQGTGLGKSLLLKACEIADGASRDVFVQANVYARAFYEKRGFRCVEEVILPGSEKYGEVFMVYSAGKAQAGAQRDSVE